MQKLATSGFFLTGTEKKMSVRTLQRITKKIYNMSPHKIRILGAYKIFQQNKDIEDVRNALRHQHISTSFYYIQKSLKNNFYMPLQRKNACG